MKLRRTPRKATLAANSDAASGGRALPPEMFYWAIVDASYLPRMALNKRQRQLGWLFERVLPLPIDEVQTAFVRLPGGPLRYLACGMEKDRLREFEDGALSVHPAAMSRQLLDDDASAKTDFEEIDCREFNLLTGSFEPAFVRTARSRCLLVAALALLVIAAGILLGLERRIIQSQLEASHYEQLRRDVCRDVLNIDTSDSSLSAHGQPPELRLLAELRTLRQTHRDLPGEVTLPNPDIAEALVAALRAWPRELHVQVESISITPGAVTIRALLPTSGEAQSLADALATIEHWQLQPPQVTSQQDNVRAILQLKPLGTLIGAAS